MIFIPAVIDKAVHEVAGFSHGHGFNTTMILTAEQPIGNPLIYRVREPQPEETREVDLEAVADRELGYSD